MRHVHPFKQPLLLAAALLLAACGTGTGGLEATDSPTAPGPTPVPGVATSVAYVLSDDLFVYDVAADRANKLTTDGAATVERSPRFTDAGTITVAAGRRILEIDVETAESRVIRKVNGPIQALDWNPDRTRLAVLLDRGAAEGIGLTLHISAFGDDDSADVRRFKPWLGRGGSDSDEVSVTWSPDGTMILVVLTPLDTVSDTTMFVLRPDGTDVVEPRFGTMARWSADSGTVYYRDFGAPNGWHALDIDSGSTESLEITASTTRPVLSPDGTMLAYDDAQENPTIYVYDVEAGAERMVTTGLLGPLWLDDSTLAATKVSPCTPDANCEGSWIYDGEAMKVSVDDGTTTDIALPSTIHQAHAFYG